MADGCATKIAAINQLTEYLGVSPSIRRVLHDAGLLNEWQIQKQ